MNKISIIAKSIIFVLVSVILATYVAAETDIYICNGGVPNNPVIGVVIIGSVTIPSLIWVLFSEVISIIRGYKFYFRVIFLLVPSLYAVTLMSSIY